jgi:hypothetical protein
MNRRQSLSILSSLVASPSLLQQVSLTENNTINASAYTAYLMAFFMENDQKLYYAYSRNALDWTTFNNRKYVFDAQVNLRDPFIARVKDTFHLVHTKGWDFPVIYHWESKDLIHWEGGPIQVVTEDKKRAWAPEFVYVEEEELFYVFWSSAIENRNVMHYTTTKDWKDVTPQTSAVYYDLGMDDIDLTITKYKGTYYGFHKPGSLQDNMGIGLMTSPTLNPKDKRFSFGKQSVGKEPLPDAVKPIEGPEIIKLINEEKWLIYADPFFNNFMAWETTDFTHFKKVPVSAPRGAKHCSILPVTEEELNKLLATYPV